MNGEQGLEGVALGLEVVDLVVEVMVLGVEVMVLGLLTTRDLVLELP